MRRKLVDIYWGVVFVGIGGFFLAKNLGYLDLSFSWRSSWPIVLILLGLSIVVKSFERM
ncbi:MAG TPA: DUF5668 domain-containing protein [Bacteroidota bacterium]|nr:DUF5668 domain-containing protein [Bacteroidota bacterium]